MLKKVLAALLCAALAVSAAACSGDTTSSSAPEASSAGGTSSEAPKDITLTVLDANGYGLEEYDKLVKEFEDAHPGVTIEVQHAADNHVEVMGTKINAGETPDIFTMQVGSQASGYYEYAYDFKGDPILSKFYEDAVTSVTDEEGHVYGLPWNYENMALIYNVELFEKAGINELPRTLSELEDVCKKLKEKGITPFANGNMDTWVLSHVGGHFIATQNADPRDTVKALTDGSLTFEGMDKFKNLFTFVDMMIEYGPDKPMEIGWEESENMLANGQAAMIHMGDWCEAALLEFNPKAKFAFMPLPTSDKAEDAYVMSNISWQYMVNKDSENLDMAKEFVTFLLTGDSAMKWVAETLGVVSATKGDFDVKGTLAAAASEYIAKGETRPWNHTLWPNGYNEKFGAAIQGYMLKQANAQDTMKQMDTDWASLAK